jgi:hypothetical protein
MSAIERSDPKLPAADEYGAKLKAEKEQNGANWLTDIEAKAVRVAYDSKGQLKKGKGISGFKRNLKPFQSVHREDIYGVAGE